MTILEIDSLSKSFEGNVRRGLPNRIEAVVDLTFTVQAGEFLTIIGPSGCGKSTLLRMLAGLAQPDTGRIALHGLPLPDASARQGRFGYMPQRDALLPWRSVLDNAILGAELTGVNRRCSPRRCPQLTPPLRLGGLRKTPGPASFPGV